MTPILRTTHHAIVHLTDDEIKSLEELWLAHDFGDYTESWMETAHNTCRDLGNRPQRSVFDIIGAALVGALLTIILVII